jgi:hypothetical protein
MSQIFADKFLESAFIRAICRENPFFGSASSVVKFVLLRALFAD